MTAALLLALLAGAAIPVGGTLAAFENIRPQWLERELRHGVIAFGGGVLLAAVALSLIPAGLRHVSPLSAALSFLAGGIVFLLVDRVVAKRFGSSANFLAMLTDFVPEAMALGALFAVASHEATLLALLIALQNLPEGFNAFREITAGAKHSHAKTLGIFAALALLGPLCAFVGITVFAQDPTFMGVLMLFASGGILYLTFNDIAPQAKLERHWAPALGAVLGFLTGLIGDMLIG